jgi:hypothetical protein
MFRVVFLRAHQDTERSPSPARAQTYEALFDPIISPASTNARRLIRRPWTLQTEDVARKLYLHLRLGDAYAGQ